MFTRVNHKCRWVHSTEPCKLMGSSWVVGFIRTRPGGRWVHLGSLGSLERLVSCWVYPSSLGSFGCAVGVVRFICGLLVHSRASWGSLDLSGVVGFTLVVLALIWCRWAHFVRLIRGRWVLSRAPCVSLGLSGVIGLTRERLGGRWVHLGS